MSNDNTKRNALDAIDTASAVYEAAWSKLGKGIALRRVLGGSIKKAVARRASVSQKITFYNRLEAEIEAADIVVSAPTVAQIREVRKLVATVKQVAVADATLRAGLDVIGDALSDAASLPQSVKS
jgi:hypothetical protein